MNDKLHDTLMMADKIRQLKKENTKLNRELEASKEVLFRIDTQREGLKLFARHLKKAWGPLDHKEAQECQDEEVKAKRFEEKLVNIIKEVSQDPVFKQTHRLKIDLEIHEKVTDMMSHEEKQELEHQMKVIRERHSSSN